jgi:hypothetical protein
VVGVSLLVRVGSILSFVLLVPSSALHYWDNNQQSIIIIEGQERISKESSPDGADDDFGFLMVTTLRCSYTV